MRTSLFIRSLRGRLVLAAVASIITAVAVFGIAAALLVRGQLRSSLDSALRLRAEEVAQLAVSAPAVLNAPGALESPVSGRQVMVEVLDARGRVLAQSLTLGARLLPQDAAVAAARVKGRPGFEDITLSRRSLRLYAAPIAQVGGPASGGAVVVASDTTDIGHTVGHLALLLLVVGAAAALLAALAATTLARRSLMPLRRLAWGAREVERTGDPRRRLPEGVAAPADEIVQLTGVLNRMLAALERSRQTERRFLGDASHELRTPVSSLLGNVEYLERHGSDSEVLGELRRDATRLARLVDELLALEREGAASSQLRRVQLDEVVRAVVGERDEPSVRLAAVAPSVVDGEEAALRRLLENLIENAVVHGPEGGTIEVALAGTDSEALLSVSDEGAGPNPEDRERLFERFWRGIDAAARPGAGLGLSIVAAIVERHGGSIQVEGSTFTVRLRRSGIGGSADAVGSHMPLRRA